MIFHKKTTAEKVKAINDALKSFLIAKHETEIGQMECAALDMNF